MVLHMLFFSSNHGNWDITIISPTTMHQNRFEVDSGSLIIERCISQDTPSLEIKSRARTEH